MQSARNSKETALFMLETLEEQIGQTRGTVTAMELAAGKFTDQEAINFVRARLNLRRRQLDRMLARLPRLQQLVARHEEYSQIEAEIQQLVARRLEILNPFEQAVYNLAKRGDQALCWD